MNEELFKPGSIEDTAMMASRELHRQRPEISPEETDNEILDYVMRELDKGRSMDDLVVDLVQMVTPSPARQRELLVSIRARIDKTLQGAGKEFDLTND